MEKVKVEKMVCARVPTPEGEFQLCLYRTDKDDKEHLALIMGNIKGNENVLVRIHSECFTGDVLGSQRCDCGEQLRRATRMIAAAGTGALIYLRQEGRGIGLLDKLRAYNLQDQGYDTVDANFILGHQADERDYTVAAEILRDLGIFSLDLLTNNPLKIKHLKRLGLHIRKRVPIESTITTDNAGYMLTKARRMHHLLGLGQIASPLTDSGNGVD